MRYFDDEYDDDEFEDEEYEDDDDTSADDEESGSSRSRVNPFTNRPAASSTSGLPGAGRSTAAGSGSSLPASRLPGSNPPARPAGSTGAAGSSGTSGPLGSRLGSSGSSGSGSSYGSGSSGSSGSSYSGSGSRYTSGSSTSGSGSGSSGGAAGSSGSRFGGSSSGTSGSSGSGSSYGSGSSSGSSYGSGSSSSSSYGGTSGSSGSSGSGGRYGSGSGARPAGSSSSGASASSGPPKPATPSAKPDDKKPAASGGAGGIGSRLGGIASGLRGGGDKKDDKKPASSSSGSTGGLTSRLGDLTSGVTGRFGGSDKKDDKKPASGSSGSSGGLTSRLGGLTSGITGRFGGGDKKPATPAAGSSSSGYKPSSPGGASASSGAKPAGGAAPARPFGSLGGGSGAAAAAKPAAAATAKAAPAAGGLSRFLPFGKGGEAAKKSAKPRTSKAPKVESGGLTLDNKLDILGVGLVLGALALLFSSASPNKGALTEAVNRALSQMFGWGALAIPIAMAVAGGWLIARHFGEDAPVVPRERIIGVIMTFIGILLAMQFFDTFNGEYYGEIVSLADLRVKLELASNLGRGGGWIGGQLYYLLVANITEFGAFFAMVGWLIVGLMFTLSISAAELAMIMVSFFRSFNVARRQRAARRAAKAAELAAAQLTAAPAISISAPAAEALPAGMPVPALPAAAMAALPEPAAAEASRAERNISINIGGRSVPAFGDPELVPLEAGASRSTAPVPPVPARAEQSASPTGSLSARLRGALPGMPGKTADKPAETAKPEEKPTAAGIGSRLFGRGKPEEKPASPAIPASAAPQASTAQRDTLTPASPQPAPTASAAPFAPDSPPAEQEPARLGDLLRSTSDMAARRSATTPQTTPAEKPTAPERPAAAFTSRPFGTDATKSQSAPPAAASAAPAPVKPPEKTAEELEAERLASLPPAQPRGTGPLPRPDEQRSRFGPTTFGTPRPAPAGSTAEAGTPAERLDRLNALRSGNLGETPKTESDKPAEVKPAAASAVPVTNTPEQTDSAAPETPMITIPGSAKAVEPPSRPVAVTSAPPTPARPERDLRGSTLPPPETRPAAPSFGRPTMPPGVPEPTDQQPAASAAAADKPAGENLPASPEIALRQPGVGTATPARKRKEWKLPNLSTLLMAGSEQDIDRDGLLKRARLIEDTLGSFGAPGKVVEVNTGPVITQFGVEPDYITARGGKKNRVKVSAIAQLDKDLQLALGAKSIRVEAPVPGKGYVGIEVPNEEAALVSLRDVMESEEFKRIKSPLAIALGQDVAGTPISADLSSMPHLLIAGTTGSGKSVCVNAIITSLIIQNSPERVKFIMVDPKRVELTGYNGIPHLVAPVVVDLERIVGVLKWVTREMDERYKKFSNAGARNIEDFNRHLSPTDEIMPYIVVIIDELADLMMLAPDETERVITRIAALARATGIHLVIATQRPSVDVVTGLIKANFPARIAFAVAGGVDSRVILDQPGAEKLLGRGDMLYLSGDSPSALRLQGVYVSDNEINNITRYWRSQGEDDVASRPINQLVLDNTVADNARAVNASAPTGNGDRSTQQQAFWDRDRSSSVTSGPLSSSDDDDNVPADGEDEMYDEAVELVRRLQKASVSLLQRRLRIGYTRAARLIDRMEEEGIVGPATEGSKPREVLPLD